MAINLEIPRKLQAIITKTHQGTAELIRPIARKYDLKEHAYPVELDTLITLFEGASESYNFAGADALRGSEDSKDENHNGANMAALVQTMEASWADVAMMLSIPYQGLGNAAISAVATDEQLERLGKVWAAMAITEPAFGSDSAAVSTTATLDGDEYVINGEKIFVTAGSRATHIVVWATLDKSKGRAAIKSFIVAREHPGVIVERLEHKLGIKGSDTAVIRFDNARIPKDNLLGKPEIEMGKGFSGVMETFDNTRPIVAAMLSALAAPPWRRSARSSPMPASTSTTTGPRTPRVPPRPSSCGWKPIGNQLPAFAARGMAGGQQDPQLQGSLDQ